MLKSVYGNPYAYSKEELISKFGLEAYKHFEYYSGLSLKNQKDKFACLNQNNKIALTPEGIKSYQKMNAEFITGISSAIIAAFTAVMALGMIYNW